MFRFRGIVALCTLLTADLSAQQAIVARDYGLTPPYRELSVNHENCTSVSGTVSCGAPNNVTFNSAVYLPETEQLYNPFSQVNQGAVVNGVNVALDFSVSIHFNRKVRSAAFNFLGFNEPLASRVRFDVMNDDELVSSFMGDGVQFGLAFGESLLWWGFEDSLFDRIVIVAPFAIDPENQTPNVFTMALNNLQILDAVEEPAVVPEPSALALAMLGLSGLAIASRRRRR